jgi:hypothetical protein
MVFLPEAPSLIHTSIHSCPMLHADRWYWHEYIGPSRALVVLMSSSPGLGARSEAASAAGVRFVNAAEYDR